MMRKPLITLAFSAILLTSPLAVAPAMAAPAASVRVDDLDLGTEAGKAALETRIKAAANVFCADYVETGTRLARISCERQVRDEVLAHLAKHQPRLANGS